MLIYAFNVESGSWADCCQNVVVNVATPVYRDKPGSKLDDDDDVDDDDVIVVGSLGCDGSFLRNIPLPISGPPFCFR